MMLTWITLAPLGALSIPNPLATAAAAAAADDTVTLWDMSLVEDAEAEAAHTAMARRRRQGRRVLA